MISYGITSKSRIAHNCRVGLSGENSEPKYVNFLCFVVSFQTNKLMRRRGGIGYSKLQMQTHNLIKPLHANGMGYRRIAKVLNKKSSNTKEGYLWKNSNVFSVLK